MEMIITMYLKQFCNFLSQLLLLESILLLGIIPGLVNLTLNQYALRLKYTFYLKQFPLQPKIFPNKTWVIS
jgi:hypothetical protein